MSLEAARAAKARELAGKTYAPLMREIEELAVKFKEREFELKFDEFKQRQSGQEAMIMQNNDEKFCKSELEKVNKLLTELKK